MTQSGMISSHTGPITPQMWDDGARQVWDDDGPKSVPSRPKVGPKSAQSWPKVSPKSAQSQSQVGHGPLAASCQLAARRQPAAGRRRPSAGGRPPPPAVCRRRAAAGWPPSIGVPRCGSLLFYHCVRRELLNRPLPHGNNKLTGVHVSRAFSQARYC